ncbi:MAG: trypsin-like peptidase domain-containing protein, partial [Tepidiformaceae bacterium]
MTRNVRSTLVATLMAAVLLVSVACSSNMGNPLIGATPASNGGATAQATAPAAAQPANAPNPGISTEQLVAETQPAVVRIQTNVGVGTGFIVEKDGYIMTNNHVVLNASGSGNASQIQVGLNDGSTYT